MMPKLTDGGSRLEQGIRPTRAQRLSIPNPRIRPDDEQAIQRLNRFGGNMERPDYFDILVKATPFLVKVSRNMIGALLPGQRERIRDAERLRRIGDSHYRNGQYELAVRSLWESLRSNSRDTLAWLYLIRAYRASNQNPLALVAAGCALHVTGSPSRQARIWCTIGHCSRDSFERSRSPHDFQSAIAAFDRARELDPSDVLAPWNLLKLTLLTTMPPDLPPATSATDVPLKTVNITNDLIAILRNGSGNAAMYADQLVVDIRELSKSIRCSEYWIAQLTTLEENARALSQIASSIAEPARSSNRNLRAVVGVAAAIVATIFALAVTGCNSSVTGLDSEISTIEQQQTHSGEKAQSMHPTNATPEANSEGIEGAIGQAPSDTNRVYCSPSKVPEQKNHKWIEHINGDDGRSWSPYFIDLRRFIEHENGDDGMIGVSNGAENSALSDHPHR